MLIGVWQRHDSVLYSLCEEHEEMKARQVFHALMSSKGYTYSDLSMDGDKYTNPAMQGRWNYFIAGWEMRGVCD
jgi:hypothetical protein